MTEKEDVTAEIDINGDGKPELTLTAVVKDKRVLLIAGIIIAIIAGTKAAGLW